MDKKKLVISIVLLIVGLVLSFAGPSLFKGKETLVCLMGAVLAFVGTQSIVEIIIEKSHDGED